MPNTQNPIMVFYGAAVTVHPGSSFRMQYNTLINTRTGSTVGVQNPTAVHAELIDNIFQGITTPLAGRGGAAARRASRPDYLRKCCSYCSTSGVSSGHARRERR
jgi:hypothetical protein